MILLVLVCWNSRWPGRFYQLEWLYLFYKKKLGYISATIWLEIIYTKCTVWLVDDQRSFNNTHQHESLCASRVTM